MGQQHAAQKAKTNLPINAPPTSQPCLPTPGAVHPLLHLQRTIGNRAVQGLIQAKLKIGQPGDRYEQEADRVADQVMRMPVPGAQRQVEPEEEEEEILQTQPLAGQITPLVQRQVVDEEEEALQPKLLSGQIAGLIQRQLEDEEEEESIQTKSLAERTPAPLIQRKCAACASGQGLCPNCAREEEGVQRKPLASTFAPLIQRQNEEPEEEPIQTKLIYPLQPTLQRQEEPEDEEETLQSKKASGHTPKVTPGIATNINTMRGGGRPLSPSVRAFFEPRFGYDFSGIRVHTDGRAAETAQSINAKAFTIGRDVVFGTGQYVPETAVGKKLLGHELTHVVQQQGGSKLPKRAVPSIQTKLTIGFPGDRYEQEADQVADRVMRMPERRLRRQAEPEEEEEETVQTQPLIGQSTPLVQRQVADEVEEEKETIQPKPFSGQIAGLIQRQMKDKDEEESIQTKPLSEQTTSPLVQRKCTAEEGIQRQPLAMSITSLIQRQGDEEIEEEEEEEDVIQQGQASRSPRLQRKPLVGPVDDAYEREADQVAAKVMGISAPSPGANRDEPAVTGENLGTARELTSGGSPLPESVRSFYEAHLGYDLTGVRIHTGPDAERRSENIKARAFTYGNHIWLGKNERREPSYVIAHELAHVIQQQQPPRLGDSRSEIPHAVGNSLASPQQIQRQIAVYWVPKRVAKRAGARIHKELLSKAKGSRLRREVLIPNGARKKKARGSHHGIGFWGQADLYWSSKPVGLYFDADAKPRNLEKQKNGNSARPQVDGDEIIMADEGPSEIKLGELKPASEDELKYGKDQLDAYKEGLKLANKLTNLFVSAMHKKKKKAGTPPQWKLDPSDINWLEDGDVKFPGKYNFKPSRPKKDEELVVAEFTEVEDEVKTRFDPDGELGQKVKGGLYAKYHEPGLWAWFARPANIKAALGLRGIKKEQREFVKFAQELQNRVIKPIKSSPFKSARKSARRFSKNAPPNGNGVPNIAFSRPRIRPDATLLIRRKGRKPVKRKDSFDEKALRKWNEAHEELRQRFIGKDPTKRKASDPKNFKKLRLLEYAYAAEENLDKQGVPGKSKLPRKENLAVTIKTGRRKRKRRSLLGLYGWIDLWTNPLVRFLGRFRKAFGGLFVKVANAYGIMKKKFKDAFARKGKTAKSSWGRGLPGAIARVAFKLIKFAASKVIGSTLSLLRVSIEKGVNAELENWFKSDEIETLQKKFEEVKNIELGLQGKFEEAVEEFAKRFVKPYEDKIKFIEKLHDTVGKITRLINIARWIYRLIACVSPPVLGCLWIAVEVIADWILTQMVESCKFQEKVTPIIKRLDIFKDLSVSLAQAVRGKMINLLGRSSLPLDRLFAEITKAKLPKPAISTKGCGHFNGNEEAFFKLQQELGEEKIKVLQELAKKAGIPENTPFKKPAKDLLNEIKALSLEELKVYAKNFEKDPTAEGKRTKLKKLIDRTRKSAPQKPSRIIAKGPEEKPKRRRRRGRRRTQDPLRSPKIKPKLITELSKVNWNDVTKGDIQLVINRSPMLVVGKTDKGTRFGAFVKVKTSKTAGRGKTYTVHNTSVVITLDQTPSGDAFIFFITLKSGERHKEFTFIEPNVPPKGIIDDGSVLMGLQFSG